MNSAIKAVLKSTIVANCDAECKNKTKEIIWITKHFCK